MRKLIMTTDLFSGKVNSSSRARESTLLLANELAASGRGRDRDTDFGRRGVPARGGPGVRAHRLRSERGGPLLRAAHSSLRARTVVPYRFDKAQLYYEAERARLPHTRVPLITVVSERASARVHPRFRNPRTRPTSMCRSSGPRASLLHPCREQNIAPLASCLPTSVSSPAQAVRAEIAD